MLPPFDNRHAVAVDIGITIKLISVRLNVIEPDAVAVITNVSNGFNIVVNVLYFVIFCIGADGYNLSFLSSI